MAQEAIDLDRARQETPGCAQVLHFNNAGAALMPQPVLHAVVGHLQLESLIGGYEAAAQRHDAVEGCYASIAHLINARPDEVAIVENATRAWDMAFYALPFRPGDRILTAEAEYGSNFVAYLQVAKRTGAVVEVVPSDESGQLSTDALRDMIDDRVKLVAITHVPTNGGLVNPAAAVGRITRQAGIPFLLDACQSVGQMPIDVEAIGCDMLSATSRKYLRGPRGMGFLYVRRTLLDRLEPPFVDIRAAEWVAPDRYTLRPDARRFENWESDVAAKIGMGVAIDYALGWGLDAIETRVSALAAQLREGLADLSGVTVRDLGRQRCGIVTFTVEDVDCGQAKQALATRRMNVTVSGAGSTRLDMQARGLAEVLRASVHYYNSEDEVSRLIEAVAALRHR